MASPTGKMCVNKNPGKPSFLALTSGTADTFTAQTTVVSAEITSGPDAGGAFNFRQHVHVVPGTNGKQASVKLTGLASRTSLKKSARKRTFDDITTGDLTITLTNPTGGVPIDPVVITNVNYVDDGGP